MWSKVISNPFQRAQQHISNYGCCLSTHQVRKGHPRAESAKVGNMTAPTKNVIAVSHADNRRSAVERTRMPSFHRANEQYQLYSRLGVKPGAMMKDIKSSYYYLAKLYHPDARTSGDMAARRKFQEISEAYEVLSDETRRQEYDEKQATQMTLESESRYRSDEKTGTFHQKSHDGNNNTEPKVVEVPFLDAIYGVESEIFISVVRPCTTCVLKNMSKRNQTRSMVQCNACRGTGFEPQPAQSHFKLNVRCKKCRGTKFAYEHLCSDCKDRGTIHEQIPLMVTIPEGTKDNDVYRVMHPISSTPLTITIKVLPHAHFERRGFDVYSTIWVPYSMASLGGTYNVDQLYGGNMQVKIPAGTECDSIIRVPGKGIKKQGGSGYGDHVLVIKIQVHRRLSDRQRQLLATFATLENHAGLDVGAAKFKNEQNEASVMAAKQKSKKFSAITKALTKFIV